MATTARPLETFTLPNGTSLNTHAKGDCKGDHCAIHNPSNHHMVDWPQNWRDDIFVMERVCEHGIGHPDPDHISFDKRPDVKSHGCDGCCIYINPFIEDVIELMETYE